MFLKKKLFFFSLSIYLTVEHFYLVVVIIIIKELVIFKIIKIYNTLYLLYNTFKISVYLRSILFYFYKFFKLF